MPLRRRTVARQPLPLRLLRVNVHPLGEDWGDFRMVYWFWRVYQVDRSGASVILGTQEVPLEPGVVHVLPGGVTFRPRCRASVRLFSVHADLPALPEPLRRSFFPSICRFPVAGDPGLTSLAAGLRRGCRAGNGDGLAMQELLGWMHQLVARLLRSLRADQLDRLPHILERRDRLGVALEKIHGNLSAPLSNRTIGETLNVSADHAVRLFRQSLGITPGRYVEEARMRRASQLLLDTDASIEEIADQTGFRDRYYFSRVFKRRFGLGPATFRKRAGCAPG